MAIAHVTVCAVSMCFDPHVFDHAFYGFQIYFAFYFTVAPIIGLHAAHRSNVELAHWFCFMSATSICVAIPSTILAAYYLPLAYEFAQYYQDTRYNINWILAAPSLCLIFSALSLCLAVISFLTVFLRSRNFISSTTSSFREK